MKSYQNNEITQALKRGSQLHLDNQARQRMRLSIFAIFDTVTSVSKQRYTNNESIKAHLSTLMVRPMIPIIIALVLMAGTTGTAIAADNAKPGDALFGVDQALEEARLSFAFGDDAKSQVWVDIAEERESEMQVLIEEGETELAEEAADHAARALDNALIVINRVRAEHEDEGKSSEALDDVSEKLEEVQNRFIERQREQTGKALEETFGEVELEAEIDSSIAKVKIKINNTEQEYTLNETDLASIIESIRSRTGLSTEDIAIMLKLDRGSSASDDDDDADEDQSNGNTNDDLNDEEGDDADEDGNGQENRNRNANQNRNGAGNSNDSNENVNEDNSNDDENANSNTNEDEAEDETEDVEDGN
ncbi:MAG: hypothetical protein HZC01_04595 [Candidatus Kerfeldbacteria bacterium]|nr:hypothetical protein [Candidatus Kerfeldbacteria bacterium]